MFSHILNKKSFIVNDKFRKYMFDSIHESIEKKIKTNTNTELINNNAIMMALSSVNDNDDYSNNDYTFYFLFLSIPSFLYYFYYNKT